MANRPVVLVKQIAGGGLALAIEFPPGIPPGPVFLSQADKDSILMELTGQHPIPEWVRIPAVAVNQSFATF